MSEELYTPQEVADLLKIKKNTVYELIKRGDLKCKKIGKQFRIHKDELDDYLNLSGERPTVIETGQKAAKQYNSKSRKEIPTVLKTTDTVEQGSPYPKAGTLQFKDKAEPFVESNSRYANKGLVICGQDILLEVLCNYLSAQITDIPIFRSYQGSYNGLYALYQDKIDVATVHLWDGETGEYNKQFVKRMLPGTKYQRIHLINRMQGFYVKEGNPKHIKTFQDLIREDVTIINREKGSGTRILLDEHLIKLGIKNSNIKGYEKEMNSHLACAGAVARGSGDVAMGIERITKELKGIDFIPIQMESYDLVMKEEAVMHDWYQKLIYIINSKDFQEEILRMSGYDITNIGMIMDQEN